jgi:hypothetical protein
VRAQERCPPIATYVQKTQAIRAELEILDRVIALARLQQELARFKAPNTQSEGLPYFLFLFKIGP